MNPLPSRVQAFALISAFCIVNVARLSAQTTEVPPNPTLKDEETIELSPFVVQASDADDGYLAKDTLAGTRVRTELRDIASSISVVTKKFLQDTGATSSASLLKYTTNTEVGGIGGNFSGNAGSQVFDERGTLARPNSNTRVRGLDSADNTRDYFLTDIPWDGFNVDRVDLQRGPNSILFGVGSPAGIINTSVNGAAFKNKNVIENRVGQFGSVRFSADVNYVLMPNELAIRVAAVDDNTKYRQKPAYNHDRRLFGAVTYNPKLFAEGSNTSIRAKFEQGRIDANRPRTLPPADAISSWFYNTVDSAGNKPLNKFTYNPNTTILAYGPYNDSSQRTKYPYAYTGQNVGRQNPGAPVVAYYGDNTSSTPTSYVVAAGGSERFGLNAAGVAGTSAVAGDIQGKNVFTRPIGINNYYNYIRTSGIPGGDTYFNKTISDPSIFDFYNNLVDGENKSERENWNAFNVALSQTFFHDRVGFEAVYDYQRHNDGQETLVGYGNSYMISVDMVNTLYDGSPNPNVGRAFITGETNEGGSKRQSKRDGFRFTTFGELRAEDFLGKSSKLSRILGKHVFTGLLSQDTERTLGFRYDLAAASPEYPAAFGEANKLTDASRFYNFVSYLSKGSLAGQSSAAGSKLSRIENIIQAPKSANVRVFDSHWNKPTNPSAVGYVDPAAPYTYIKYNSVENGTAPIVSTQSENPANYVGWTSFPVNFIRSSDGDIDALIDTANRSENIITSKSFTWQGHMFDGAFVPVFGWRRDRISANSRSGDRDASAVVSRNFSLRDSDRSITTGESKSWGGVLHLPESWTRFIPGDTKVSVFYNRSSNFRAELPRADPLGNRLDNPRGNTKEYGVVVNTLQDKLTVKATWYETKVVNAASGAAFDNFWLPATASWGLDSVIGAEAYVRGDPSWDSSGWGYDYAAIEHPSTAPAHKLADGSVNPAWLADPSTKKQIAAIDAWKKIGTILPQSFWNIQENGDLADVNAAAIVAGDWSKVAPSITANNLNHPGNNANLKGYSRPGITTVDTLSKGVELELSAQPTKNWNVSVNASKTFASRDKMAPTIAKVFEDLNALFAGPAGDIRIWGGTLVGELWKAQVANPYATFKSQQGGQAPEIAPWRFNGVSTYTFSNGRLKGAFFGGAYRWEEGRVLGYRYNPKLANGQGALDVSQPFKGSADNHADLWFGYSRDVAKKVNWRIQLNLVNVGESKRLVPLHINPDGAVAFSRIAEGMTWQLTNTFTF